MIERVVYAYLKNALISHGVADSSPNDEPFRRKIEKSIPSPREEEIGTEVVPQKKVIEIEPESEWVANYDFINFPKHIQDMLIDAAQEENLSLLDMQPFMRALKESLNKNPSLSDDLRELHIQIKKQNELDSSRNKGTRR